MKINVYKVSIGDGRYGVKDGVKTYHVIASDVVQASRLAGENWHRDLLVEGADFPLNSIRVDEEYPLDASQWLLK